MINLGQAGKVQNVERMLVAGVLRPGQIRETNPSC